MRAGKLSELEKRGRANLTACQHVINDRVNLGDPGILILLLKAYFRLGSAGARFSAHRDYE